jgi:hypothetical protein
MQTIIVQSITIKRKELNLSEKHKKLLPLLNSYVSIEFKGITIAYINAFRRTSIDEVQGYALQVPVDMDWSETTDEFMLPQFVTQRISLISLKPNLGTDYGSIRFNLDVKNDTYEIMNVYSKDLKLIAGNLSEVIFNPMYIICVLQPGKRIVINDIYITTGFGKDNTAFQRVRCGAYKFLDIKQYSYEETHLSPDKNLDLENLITSTHTNINKNKELHGSKVNNSGYVESCMVANPKHHLYSCIIPSTNSDSAEIISVFVDVCNNIKDRIRYILSYIESIINVDIPNNDIEYNIFQLSDGVYEGNLIVRNETYTIGELIKDTIYSLIPDIINIKYVILYHDNSLKITIHYKEHITNILIKSLKYCISVFDLIQKQIQNIKPIYIN